MKRKILGFAAIVIAIAASAFTVPTSTASTKTTNYYWFQVSSGANIAVGDAVPKADATYLNFGASPIGGTGCGSGTNQCVSGFTSTQINSSTHQLKDDNEVSPEPLDTRN